MTLPVVKRARLAACIGATFLALVAAEAPVATADEAPAPAARSLPSGNLILNPGAEAGVGGDLPSWDTTPGFVAETYGAEFRPGVEVSQQIGGGAQLFAGGSESTVSYGTQVIDVSQAAEEIDAVASRWPRVLPRRDRRRGRLRPGVGLLPPRR